MKLTRRSFLTHTAALAALGGLEFYPDNPAGAAGTVTGGTEAMFKLPPRTLQGFGTISGVFRSLPNGSSLTHITCESVQKALLTQAKYLSDLERLPGIQPANLPVGGRSIPFQRTATGGAVACFARGHDVLILAAEDEGALTRLCGTALPVSTTAAEFGPRAAIPMWLDRWDKYGLILYFGPGVTAPNTTDETYDFADALTFARDNGPLGLVFWANPLTDDYSEGLTNEQGWGWVQENARKMGIPIHINTQISPPQLWLANRYREQTMLKAPQFLGGYYGVSHDSAGTGAISWLSQEAEDALLGVFQGIVRQYAKDPNIVGWLEPHGETGETPQKFFLDSGPYADEVMRGFLRRRYGTLRAVSERWHGDAGFYKTWADVHLPEMAEFAGFGPGAIDLRGTWRVKYVPAPDGHIYDQGEARGLPSPPPTAPVPPEWSMPGFDDSGWDELIAPGNDRMLYMSRSPMVYRRTVNVPADWLAANPQVTLTIWDMVNRDMDKTVVTVNGHPVVEQSHRANDQHWSEFNVTAALQPGANLLVLQMPRAIICYRAYLTGVPPRQYPRLGPQKNAQWADFVDFIIETRSAQIRRGAEMIRQVDPNSSINFMAAEDYADGVAKAAQDYGGRFHDTGAMAGFWTDSNTLRMCGAGLPVTAEPGNGAPNIREFQMFWGRWLTEGVTGVHYFQNWGEIAWNPDVLKVFEANRAMYTAVGKYHVPFAKVAVLFNLQSNWLTDFPWSQEPNSQGGYYSGFNAAAPLLNYCPRDTIGAIDFETSNADKYRVIIDGNSSITSEELIGNIEKFVRRGGVFITYGQTGRHTPSHVDSWPISKLTGFDVVHDWGWGDGKSMSVAPGQSVLTAADLPPQTRTAGLSLKPATPDAKTLAAWDDGSTAIGMRPLGAGWMVHVGPYMGGDPFVAVYGSLLRHFGMTDRVPARATPRPGLHLRHFIGNTGLHDVWILFNESDAATTTDLTFLPGVHPASLTDIVTGDKLDITRDPVGDAVRGIALDRWQSHMYLSPRAGVAASPPEWLALQSGWWQGTVKPPVKHLPTPAEQQKFSLDLTEGWAFKTITGLTDEQAAAMTHPEVDDSKWERRQLDMWLTPGDKTDKRFLLRRKFTVPAHWTAGQIVLCADVPGEQFHGGTRTFLDGNAWAGGRKMVDGPYFETMGGVLKPGTTHVLALDTESPATLLGSDGPIWLYYLPEPDERQDLAGTWTGYSDPLHKIGDFQLPGNGKGMILSRTVVIDPVHAARNVVVYVEATGDMFSVMINGQLILHGPQVREHTTVFNITPMVKFGQENLIELLGHPGPQDKPVRTVEIRYYEKGVYP